MKPVILITGGSRGIGAATALLAAHQGFAVGINYSVNAKAANAMVDQIKAGGGQAIAIQGDVADEAQVIDMFKVLDQQLGTLSALINNAGVVDVASRVDSMSVQRLRRMFDINLLGSFLCAREAVRRMSTLHGGKGGSIVNVSSVASRLGGTGQYVDYAASKGAIDTMTVGLAKEVALEGIRVNAVRPGIIDTEIHASGGQPNRVQEMTPLLPMKRPGTAEEVAQAIMWLVSPSASYTTGSFVDVTGGR